MAASTSIAQDLPYDVLGQIFLLCLPSDPLDQRQPDVTQAPMLLCQICSHWRSVALDTSTIWIKLYHVCKKYTNTNPGLRVRDLDFLRWWRENIGSVAPFLRLSLEVSPGLFRYRLAEFNKRLFLAHFLSSAQYLDIDHPYSIALREIHGDRPLVCPNLSTLIMRQGIDRTPQPEHDDYNIIPIKATQPIYRLFIEDISITSIDAISWSHLTHICTVNLTISLQTWFSLIRECVNLVSGEFSITMTSPNEQNIFSPPATLPRLRQMVIFTFGHKIHLSIFQNLLLPSLTSLRLDHYPSLSITRLHRILGSTPALKELHLAPDTPYDENRHKMWFPGPEDNTTPLWSVVPTLEFIHFGGRAIDGFGAPELVSKALYSSWLDLGKPENSIKQVGFGVERWTNHSKEELQRVLRDLQPEVPRGVELVARAVDTRPLWDDRKSKGASLVGCFDDMGFRDIV